MTNEERERRWRLILGGHDADGIGYNLSAQDQKLDQCLSALYGQGSQDGGLGSPSKTRRGGSSASKPKVSRWLGDIREYFPSSVVKVMQRDAIERLGLESLLLEKEVLENIEIDIHLVAQLISLKDVIPSRTKETARHVVEKVVEEIKRRLEVPLREAVSGSLNRAIHNPRPRHHEINWHRTILANLKHYQPAYQTIIPEKRIGYGKKRACLKDIILCVDQSGSMATSVVYSSIFAAVLASLPSIATHLIVFDTSIADLSDDLHHDPVDVLFGLNLGGGTDINKAVAYCETLITRPEDTIFILMSDLCEGGDNRRMRARMKDLVLAGVTCITLLALSDDGVPSYDHRNASYLANIGIPSFACTPDLFPDLISQVLSKKDLNMWAATHDIILTRKSEET
jgi:hypothetical protein